MVHKNVRYEVGRNETGVDNYENIFGKQKLSRSLRHFKKHSFV